MSRVVTILVFILYSVLLKAQVVFKTIAPQQPVVSGESFQVQYILQEGDKSNLIKPPAFTNFRFVAGPNSYMGSVSTVNGVKSLHNSVYTLEAGRPGKFVIPGATTTFNGKTIRSNDVMIWVISKKEAAIFLDKQNSNPDYFLRPGENVYEKIRQNLFVKVTVDKKNCYVGEPVLATFKLYSRLESKSDIVKNPGLYGFTVFDMVSLGDKQVTTENFKGKIFDVHTIRKMQLYPLQAGIFTVDAMEIKNKVEFSRSAVTKKTEQKITEGILGDNDTEMPAEGKEVFETHIHTEPVLINVKAVPEKNKPLNFNGAAGNFTISSYSGKNKLKKNEEGFLEIKISGKGNFIQLSAPAIQWPEGMEGFEPLVKDALEKTSSPLTGSRTFRYPFVSSLPAVYLIPAISFSYFNTDSGTYKTITAPAVQVSVSSEKKIISSVTPELPLEKIPSGKNYLLIVIIVFLVGGVVLFSLQRKRGPMRQAVEPAMNLTISVQQVLAPVYHQIDGDDKNFYSSLQQSIWQFFNYHFNLTGSEMKKNILLLKLAGRRIDKTMLRELDDLLQVCETGMFTNANPGRDKEALLEQARLLMEEINQFLL